MGLSKSKKSDPSWATRTDLPSINSCIFTLAEWPPLLVSAIMDENLIQKAQVYVGQHQLCLGARLGFGIHGIIFTAEGNIESMYNATAVKVLRAKEPYEREKSAYERLNAASISKILDFNVPSLLRYDDEKWVIEMTIVTRPFVLDFAGAYLDFPPVFSDEIWADWETEKQDQFGERWSEAQRALAALRNLNIHMIDVSPSNIAFAD